MGNLRNTGGNGDSQSVGFRRRVRRSLAFVLALSGAAGFYACGGGGNSGSPSTGNDAGNEASLMDTTGGGMDTGTDTGSPPAESGVDGGQDTGTDAETGDAGEPCTPPNSSCNPGLYCSSISGTCVPSSCQGKTYRSLPYNIASDFNTVFSIGPEADNFKIIPNSPDCDSTTYPAIPFTGLLDSGLTATPDGGNATLDDGAVQLVSTSPSSSCYEFLYDPSCLNGCWAGGIITNSVASALGAPGAVVSGSAVGVCIAPGATTISFMAKASLPGATVKFGSSRPGQCTQVNPINPDGGTTDPTYEQTVCPGMVEFFIQLSTQWQMYTLSLPPGEPYNDEPNSGGGVWNGFSVVVEPPTFVGGSYIFVKDIVWTNQTIGGYDAGPVITPISDSGPTDSGGGG
jgi:hypothetical protein